MSKTDSPVPAAFLETLKANALKVDPFALLLESVDFPAGPSFPPGEADRLKAPLDESMVESICKFGVIRHVLARKDGERYIVVDGRRRVMHARAASLRLQALGQPALRVLTSLVRGDEIQLFGLSRIANSFSLVDPPITNAKNAQWMLDKGGSVEEVAGYFGVKPVTVTDWLKLLDLTPELQTQVQVGPQGGGITTNAALALAELSMADQVAAMGAARDAAGGGKVTTAHVTRAAQDAKVANGGKPVKATPKERVEKALGVIGALCLTMATGKTKMDNVDDVLPTLKRVTIILGDRKFDAIVKSLLPKDEAESE